MQCGGAEASTTSPLGSKVLASAPPAHRRCTLLPPPEPGSSFGRAGASLRAGRRGCAALGAAVGGGAEVVAAGGAPSKSHPRAALTETKCGEDAQRRGGPE